MILLKNLITKNYKTFVINAIVFLFVSIVFTMSEKTYKTFSSEIKIFSEPMQSESKNILPYLYAYNSDEQNNQVIIADIISRDLIEGFIRKYNYNFKIVSKEPKNLEIGDIIINKELEPNRVYKVRTNSEGDIQIKSNINGVVEIKGMDYYEAFNNFLRNMSIQTYTLDEMIGERRQNNLLGTTGTSFKIISVSLYSSEPFVNELARKFKDYLIEYNLEKKIRRFKNSKEFVSKQIESYLAELDNLNYKIRSLQMTNNFIGDDSKNPIISELFDIKKKQMELSTEIQSLNNWLSNSADENEIVTSDPFIQKAIKDIILFKDTLDILLVKYGSSSSEYTLLNNTHKKLKNDLKRKVIERIRNLEAQLELLKRNELKLRNELNTSFETEREAISLMSRKKAIEDIIIVLSQRMEEIKIQEAEIIPDFRILEFTEKPHVTIKGRNWVRNIIFGIIFSLFFSTLILIVKEYNSDVLKNIDNLGLKLNVQKAYVIPNISQLEYSPFNVLKEKDYKKIIEGHIYLESFRILVLEENLYSNCIYGVISSVQGEGKSFISLNLSSTIAMMNKNVVIVDCDIRKGDITELAGKSKNEGISDIFNNNFENLVHPYLENLNIVPKGLTFIDPIAIFSNNKFDEFLKFLKDRFDVVILDLPPVLRVAETTLIIDKIESLIFTMRLNYTPIEIIKSSLLRIPKEKIKVYVVNDFDVNSNYGYKQKYYYKTR